MVVMAGDPPVFPLKVVNLSSGAGDPPPMQEVCCQDPAVVDTHAFSQAVGNVS